jgi:hypothetical protein
MSEDKRTYCGFQEEAPPTEINYEDKYDIASLG